MQLNLSRLLVKIFELMFSDFNVYYRKHVHRSHSNERSTLKWIYGSFFINSTIKNCFTLGGASSGFMESGSATFSPSSNVCDHFTEGDSKLTLAFTDWLQTKACTVIRENGPVLSGGAVHTTLLQWSLMTHVPLSFVIDWIFGQYSCVGCSILTWLTAGKKVKLFIQVFIKQNFVDSRFFTFYLFAAMADHFHFKTNIEKLAKSKFYKILGKTTFRDEAALGNCSPCSLTFVPLPHTFKIKFIPGILCS